jgi:signal transduction histidine kinase/ligand-binding sensor domain-containing protein/DNA-binding response OmpR family regulator
MNRLGYIILTSGVFIFLNQSAYSQPNQPFFKHITTDEGLSFNSVYSILQDKQGFLWFGTLDGLNRYDGIEFRNYRVIDKKYFQDVSPLIEDSLGNIWAGSILLRYNPITDKQYINWVSIDDTLQWATGIHDIVLGPDKRIYFISVQKIYWRKINTSDSVIYEFNTGNSLSEFNRINKLRFDKSHKMWLGTDEGLFYYDSLAKQFVQLRKISYPGNKYVHDFLFDNAGKLWVIFTNTVFSYDILSQKETEYQIPGIKTPVLTAIYQTRNGVIWVGTTEQGLFYLDKMRNRFECLLDQNSITSIYEDRSNRLWIGTDNVGIFVYDPLQNFFKSVALPLQDKQVYKLAVTKIIPGSENGLWIGTISYGLLFYDLDKNTAFVADDVNNQINMLYRDQTGKIWYDHQKYLVCYDPENKTSRRIKHPVPLQFPIINYGNSITEMVRFNSKLIVSSDYGHVYSLDPETDHYKLIFEKERYPIRAMQVKQNSLFIAVYGLGIVVMDTSWTITDTISCDSEGPGLIAHAISALYFDTYDTLWAAGYGGLCKFNPATGQLENKFTIRESSNYLTSILEDDQANLWIGSSKGIYKYERLSQQFILFNSNHCVPAGRFFINSAAKGKDGMMYFGGNGGIVMFNPDIVKINTWPPPLVFTGFKINTKRKKVADDLNNFLKEDINHVSEIHLKYNQNSFTIEYAALNYTSTHHNQYQYKLEGLDNDWQHVGNLSKATYTNLDGGDYVFCLKGSNNDGIWNEDSRKLTIHIDTPPWKTWWAISLYILMISGIIIYVFYHTVKRLQLQHQLVIQTNEAEKLKEIDEAKSRFFTNISHEFRTPLTLIIDPAVQLLQNSNSKIKEHKLVKLIIKNAKRLLFLINQILDLTKLKNNKLKLQAEETDFIAFIKPILSAFSSKAEALQINYRIRLPERKILVWIDREKIEQTLTNLLSNAFKFCKEGEIRIEVLERPNDIVIKINDTGIGIPANQLDKIFDNYYQVEDTYTEGMAGTGIGLYLVKEYMKMHQGSVKVESKVNKGSTFTLTLLKGRDHLTEDQIVYETGFPDAQSEVLDYASEEQKIEKSLVYQTPEQSYTLLIVEDEPDMIEYLSENLEGEYKLYFATNGREGFIKILKHNPDLIISDVMMPEMDGFAFCEKVKGDNRTSHIKLILLTAKDLEKDKIKGLSLGADDYLVKPFQLNELKLRIKNSINQQIKLRDQFLNDFRIKSENELMQSMKDQFLQEVFIKLETQYREEQFGVEKLSELMNMSRKHLHHKIKTLTNQTPNELIRNFRLRKAAHMLSVKAAAVTQVCYEVGFNNLSYFSKCFNDFFGKYPSEFIKPEELM